MNIKNLFKKEKKTFILKKGTRIEKYAHCVMTTGFNIDLDRKKTYLLGKDIIVDATTKTRALRKIDRILNILYDVEVNYSSEGFYEDILFYNRNLVQEIN